MKILITGGSGFLGKKIVKRLLSEGNSLTVLTSSNSNVIQDNKNLKFRSFNLNDNKEFKSNESYDILIHLAWEKLPDYKNNIHLSCFLDNHIRFLDSVIKNRIANKIIVAGTCLEYGKKYGCLSEETKTFPTTPYGIAKDLLRQYIFEKCECFDIKVIWARIFYVNDHGENGRSILGKIKKKSLSNEPINLTCCTQMLDYLELEKIIDYLCSLSKYQPKHNEIVNISSGKPIVLKNLILSFIKHHKLKIKLNFGMVKMSDYESDLYWGKSSKIKWIFNNVKSTIPN